MVPPREAAVLQNVPPLDNREVITFAGALTLVAGHNPQIAFANEQINGPSRRCGRKVLWLPSIQAGINSRTTTGRCKTATARAILQPFGAGGRAGHVCRRRRHTGHTRRVGQVRRGRCGLPAADRRPASGRTAKRRRGHNPRLSLYAAVAYLDLLRAFQQQAIAEETLDHAGQLARLTAEFARTGQGNQADADRAQAELSVRRERPGAGHRANPGGLGPIDRTAEPAARSHARAGGADASCRSNWSRHDAAGPQLVADGLSRRPEVAQSRHLVAAAEEQLNRERYAPLLPNVLVDVSQSGFGGGPESTIADFRGRFDFDATAYWQLRNFGTGEVSARDAARSRLEQAQCLPERRQPGLPRGPQDACPVAIAPRPNCRGRRRNPHGRRVVPAKLPAHPRRPGIAAGGAAIDPGPRPEPPRISPGGRRLRRVAIPALPGVGMPDSRGNASGPMSREHREFRLTRPRRGYNIFCQRNLSKNPDWVTHFSAAEGHFPCDYKTSCL